MDESGEKICAGKDDYRHPRHRKVEQPVAHHCQHSELPKTPPSAMGSARATIESKSEFFESMLRARRLS
jgi:hypothetical protein